MTDAIGMVICRRLSKASAIPTAVVEGLRTL